MTGAPQQNWDAAVASGAVRLAVGAFLIRAPHLVARMLGADSDDRLMPTLIRCLGIRDSGLGVSALAASRPGGSARRQLRFQAAADVADGTLIAAATARGRLPRVRGMACVGVAAASAAVELALAARAPAVSG